MMRILSQMALIQQKLNLLGSEAIAGFDCRFACHRARQTIQ
jgi:hypothetical protein